MALTEDLLERLAGTPGAGVGAAVCALLVAPRIAPKLGRGVRWVAKSTIKGVLLVSYRTRTAIADAEQGWIDLYAEARSELHLGAAARESKIDSEPDPGALGSETVAETEPHREEPATEPTAEFQSPRVVSAPEPADEPVAPTSDRVNLNSADKAALMELPGVGERTAEKILQYRATHGRIESIQQLEDAEVLPGHVASALHSLVEPSAAVEAREGSSRLH